ncbi:MAG: BBP7 family outer membrane beta-barrel protein, partial [Gemmataceae bacterium]
SKNIMHNGKWIGSLIVVVLVCVASLRGEEVQWQSQSEEATPSATEIAVTLSRPTPVAQTPPLQTTTTTSQPAGLLPVGFQTTAESEQTRDPSLTMDKSPQPSEIIAVSAPVLSTVPPPTSVETEADEESDNLFAVDRPSGARPAGKSGVVRTSNTFYSLPVDNLPMLPDAEAPVDSGWGTTLGPKAIPEGFDSSSNVFASVSHIPLPPRLYLGAEYLLWWISGQPMPILATTSNPSDFGILGAPSTQVLFGGNEINTKPFSGGRFTIGYWLGDDKTVGVEVVGFFLGPNSTNYSTNSSLTPLIARPFTRADNGEQFSQLTALPGVAAGTLSIAAPTLLWGLEGNVRLPWCVGCNYLISGLVG